MPAWRGPSPGDWAAPREGLRSINPMAGFFFFALGLGKGGLATEVGGVESVGNGEKEAET